MALRFFTDHCVSNQVINALRTAGHEVFRLKEQMPAESPDTAVIAKAQELGAILLSLDGDFADIVSYPPRQYGGLWPCKSEIIPRLQAPSSIGSCCMPRPNLTSRTIKASCC